MKKNILLSSVAALSIFALNVNAEELGTIDVWETQIVSSSLNLGKDVIETKQADHLSDLLRDLPGVEVGGTHSINNRLNIRGIQDEDLEITIDGAKLSNVNMFHHVGNLLINPDILKKADIQVGSNSVVNGGLGGSMAFETKDGKDMLKKGTNVGARISSTYNSNDSLSGSISAYGKANEDLSFLIYHNHVKKNNWEYPDGKETFGVEGKSNNTLAKVSYDINDNNTVSLSYDTLVDKGDYLPRPDFNAEANKSITGDKTFHSDYKRETITLNHKLNINDSFSLKTTLYSNLNELDRTEDWSGGWNPRSPGSAIGVLNAKVQTQGLNSQAQSNIETGDILNTLTYGIQIDKQTSKVKWNDSKYGEDEEANTKVVYLENAIDFDNGLVVTPGVRFTDYELDGSYGKRDDEKFTYALGAEYELTDNLNIFANVSTLYKGVPMVDVMATNRLHGNKLSNVKAETGTNKEIGFDYYNNDLENFDSSAFSFKLFKTDIKDRISPQWNNDFDSASMVNGGDLELKGFEASFRLEKGNFDSLLTYSKTDSDYSDSDTGSDYEVGDKLTVNLNYAVTPSIKTSWNSIFLKAEDSVGSSRVEKKKGYGVHNASVKYVPQANKNLSIIAGVDNIFNKSYVAHSSTNKPIRGGVDAADYEAGRNIKLTMSYKF